ncbi:MAG: PAS domain S-box protein [Bacteroidales bacterium]
MKSNLDLEEEPPGESKKLRKGKSSSSKTDHEGHPGARGRKMDADKCAIDYREILNGMNDTAWVLDFDTSILDVNNSACQLLGYTRDELLSMKILTIDTSLSAGQIRNLAGNMIKDRVQVFTTSHSTKTGNIIPVEVSSSLVNYKGREVILSIARDIRNRQWLEEKLRDSEEKLKRVFQSNIVPMALWNKSGGIIDTNDTFLSLIGYSREEFQTGKVRWDKITPPEFREKDLQAISEVENMGFCRPYEKVFCHKNGHLVPILISGGTYDKANEIGVLYIVDLSESRVTQESLKESEARFRHLFETMVQGVVYQDYDGRIIDANPAAERILGLSLDQMQGRTSTDPRWHAIHEDGSEFPGNTHPTSIALQTGKIVNNTVMGVFHPADQKYVWININAIPQFRQGETKPYHVYATFEDITREKQAKGELRNSEEKYRGLMESLDNIVALVDNEGRFLYMNKVAESQFGKPAESLVGKTMHELFPVQEADRHVANIKRCIDENKILCFENQSTVAGNRKWFKTSITPIYDNYGHAFQALVNTVDVTDFKLVQQELVDLNQSLESKVHERKILLQDLYDQAPVGYHTLDANGLFTEVNKTELDWLGYTKEELIGKRALMILRSDLGELFRKAFHSLREQGRIVGLEVPVVRKNGTSFIAELNAVAIYEKDGSFAGSRTTLMDISSRKKAEEAMKKAIIDAEIANRAKSEFLLNVSHEFRTPLNAVIGFADLIEKADGPDKIIYAENVRSSGRRLLTMVDDILDLIRSEKGDFELENDTVSLKNLFSEIIDDFSEVVRGKGLSFITEISPHLPAFVTIDGHRLKQVITNLLDNAVKFTEKGKISLKVYNGVDTNSNGHPSIVIEVLDTGKGMSEEFQHKMFEVFAQADKKTVLSGIGIGLPLSQMIISKMTGTIKVTSAPGKGSCFTITIPAVQTGEPSAIDLLSIAGSELLKKPVDKVGDVKKELIEALEGPYMEIVRSFEIRQPIGEVKSFGISLHELGINHDCTLISRYGKELEKAAESFNIEKILKLLRKYGEIVSEVKN